MSFFKAPSWAKAQPKDDSDNEDTTNDLFSHTKDFMAIQRDRLEQARLKKERAKQREEERERKRKEKAAKKESKAGVKRESSGEDSKGDSVKKRRINAEESAKLLASVGIKPIAIDSDSDGDGEQIQYDVEEAAPVRRSPRTKRTKDVYGNPRVESNLRNSTRAGEDLAAGSDVKVMPAAPVLEIEESEEDSDPEIAALQRRAREKHRLKKQRLEQRSATPGAAQSDAEIRSGPPTPPPPDPIIALLITSELPDTKQLLVKRKLTQDLGTARRAWCDRQGFDQSFSDRVFFTWNGRRMYDSTTCQRLGLEVDATGKIIRADEHDADGAAQVHVIATTQEQVDLEKAEQEREAKLVTAPYEPEEEPPSAAEDEPAKASLKIVVQAKHQQPVKITVFSTTKISKIVNYARKKMGFGPEQPAYLLFDGDRIDPDDVVGDTDMADMENVDLVLGD